MTQKPTRHSRPPMTTRAQEVWDSEKRERDGCERIITELKTTYGFDVTLFMSPVKTEHGYVYHLYERGFRPISPAVSITGARMILDGLRAAARATVRGDER